MKYLGLFTPHHLAMLYDRLSENNELYIHLEYPHSGGSGTGYLIRSLDDLNNLIATQTHPEIEIFIFHSKLFPARGLADNLLLRQALQTIPDGQWYTIVSPDYYPLPCDFLAGGNNHDDLKKDLSEVFGKLVGIGINPLDLETFDLKWIYTHADEVMYFAVKKNRNSYEAYRDNPEKYKEIIRQWQEGV